MTSKTGKYAGDKLFRAISCDKDTTTIYFMYFPRHKVEATKFLNILLYILSEELLIKPTNFITRSGIERVTIVIWYKDKLNFTNPNDIYN